MNPRSSSPGCTIVNGMDNAPKLVMTSPDGATAEIYLHGAHVSSWIPVNGSEKLFLSTQSAFGSNASIRGGIPIIFPQFSDSGPLPKHGFARRLEWNHGLTQVSDQDVIAGLALADNPETLNIWPHPFQANLLVTLSAHSLTVKLKIKNAGDSPFSFTVAMHTYLSVNDIKKVKINGLYKCPYIDTALNEPHLLIQTEKSLHINGEVDRIYPDSPSELTLVEGDSRLKVSSEGFSDAVIWNPWVDKSAKMSDMLPTDYLHMLCIEAAAIQNPITLNPQKNWTASQTLSE